MKKVLGTASCRLQAQGVRKRTGKRHQTKPRRADGHAGGHGALCMTPVKASSACCPAIASTDARQSLQEASAPSIRCVERLPDQRHGPLKIPAVGEDDKPVALPFVAPANDARCETVRILQSVLASQVQQAPESGPLREERDKDPAVHAVDGMPPADPRRDAGVEGEEARPQVYAHGPHAG